MTNPGSSPAHPLRVYILRCWIEPAQAGSNRRLRFSLEPIDASRRRGFVDIDSLTSFIRGEMEAAEAGLKKSSLQEDQAEVKEPPTE